jgi:hypothetical protein
VIAVISAARSTLLELGAREHRVEHPEVSPGNVFCWLGWSRRARWDRTGLPVRTRPASRARRRLLRNIDHGLVTERPRNDPASGPSSSSRWRNSAHSSAPQVSACWVARGLRSRHVRVPPTARAVTVPPMWAVGKPAEHRREQKSPNGRR